MRVYQFHHFGTSYSIKTNEGFVNTEFALNLPLNRSYVIIILLNIQI